MVNIYAIRLFRENYGDLLDVVELFRKVSIHTIIAEEINPYQHYHLMIYSDKTLQQIKRFVSNHTIKGSKKIRNQHNTNVQVVQNEPAYHKYILKNYVRAYDSFSGWIPDVKEYNEYGFEKDLEPEAQHFWEFQQAIENNNNHIRSIQSNPCA